MTDANPPALDPSFVARVKGILLQPKREWEIIDNEYATVKSVFVPYALILAAIGPICSFIGLVFIGTTVLGTTVKYPLVAAAISSVISYGLGLVGVYLVGLIINALAPSFGGEKNPVKAMQVAVYSWTAAWVVGIFGLLPMLGILGILGLYSFYLLYLGLPKLMKAPQDKAIVYTIVAVICGIGVFFVVGLISAAVTAPMLMGGMAASSAFAP